MPLTSFSKSLVILVAKLSSLHRLQNASFNYLDLMCKWTDLSHVMEVLWEIKPGLLSWGLLLSSTKPLLEAGLFVDTQLQPSDRIWSLPGGLS